MSSFVDFDQIIDRHGTCSLKWDGVDRLTKKSSEGMWDGIDESDKEIIPLWAADMDFKAPQPVLDALQERVAHGVLGYPIRPESYNEALVDWLKKKHEWDIQPEWILSTSGILPTINLSLFSYSKPGHQVIIQTPVYYRFTQAIDNNFRRIVENPLIENRGKYEIDFDDMEQQFKEGVDLFILCNPQNPIAKVWEKETLEKMAELCLKYRVLIISDEIHSDLIYSGYKHTPIAKIAPEIADITITCVAPSKTFNIAGLRSSAAVISNPKLRNKLSHTIARMGLDVSNVFGMLGFETAYKYGAPWLNELIAYLEKNAKMVEEYLGEHLPQIHITHPESTHMMWLDFRELNLTPEELSHRLIEDAKIGLSDGAKYFGKAGQGFQRINIGTQRARLHEALQRMKKIL